MFGDDFGFYLFLFIFGLVIVVLFIYYINSDIKETKRLHDSIIKNYSDYTQYKKCYEIDNIYYCTDLVEE